MACSAYERYVTIVNSVATVTAYIGYVRLCGSIFAIAATPVAVAIHISATVIRSLLSP